ncbi:hypothetical protein B0T11DRAFT_300557 [Plectosphaerella cucumerina]|uniref:Uncharacterized protein n=1 Tax=Plectosphaerella cucumerina TaxID=40658 RepID=A0A8K0WZW7_9PEZI|nr:hypothetical protein B0T11DRAFT_300557 [Plectosphaerella cucumerina]
MYPNFRKSPATSRSYLSLPNFNNTMFRTPSFSFVSLLTWSLIAMQVFFIGLDLIGGGPVPLATIAALNAAAIVVFVLGFCFDIFIFLLPVIVSTLVTAWFLWYRIAEMVQLLKKAGASSAGWI